MQSSQFRADVIAILQQYRPEWPVDPADEPMAVVIWDMQISLNNIFRSTRDMPWEDRETAIVEFFDSIRPTPSGASATTLAYPDAKTRLMPQIVPEEYIEIAPLIVHRRFHSGLAIGYTFSDGRQYEFLQQPLLASWSIEQQEIETQAITNLETRSDAEEFLPRRAETGAFVIVAAEDSHSAARILLPDFMARMRRELNASRVFVGIPNRDFLIAWTPDFPARQAFAAKLTQDVESEPYPSTDEIFVSSDSGVALLSGQEKIDHGR